MKTAQILANIEQYVATLKESEREAFEKMLEFAEAQRTPVQTLYKGSREPLLYLVSIAQALRQDEREAAQKASKGSSFVKRSKTLAKLITKQYREVWQAGWLEEVNGEKMQCTCIEGYYCFALREPLDIPMQQREPMIQRVIPRYDDFEEIEIDIVPIRAAVSLSKAKKERLCKVEINGKYYNGQYIINIFDVLGGKIKLKQDTSSKCKGDVFVSENGLALLMPVRP